MRWDHAIAGDSPGPGDQDSLSRLRILFQPEQEDSPAHQKGDTPEGSDHSKLGRIGEGEDIERSRKQHRPTRKTQTRPGTRSRGEPEGQQGHGMNQMVEDRGFPGIYASVFHQEFLEAMSPE